MIHFVNLNATWDTVLLCDSIKHGEVNRAQAALSYPGGKGNNAARACAKMGGKAALWAFCGKKDKPASDVFYAKEKVDARLHAVEGRNRPCVVMLDAAKDEETVINTPSQAQIRPADFRKLKAGLLKAVRAGEFVAFAGSVPEGLKPDSYAELIREVQKEGAVGMLDAYGPALREGVKAAPFLLKPNAEELHESFGWPCATREQILNAAERLLRFGIRAVVITLGRRGAIVRTPREALFVAPLGESRGWHSPVGCGDAFFGALAYGLDKGLDFKDCLRQGTAAAWANLHAPGAVFFDKKLAQVQAGQVRISRLS